MKPIPWEHIDLEMRPLIRELNKIECVETIGCCIGHGLDPVGNVIFKVVDEEAWKDLMMNLLQINAEIKEANIDIFQWHRLEVTFTLILLSIIKAMSK